MDLSRFTTESDSPLRQIDGRIKTGVFLGAVGNGLINIHITLCMGHIHYAKPKQAYNP